MRELTTAEFEKLSSAVSGGRIRRGGPMVAEEVVVRARRLGGSGFSYNGASFAGPSIAAPWHNGGGSSGGGGGNEPATCELPPGMTVKDSSVNVSNLRPELCGALPVAVDTYRKHGEDNVVVTSGNDGVHKTGSLHGTNGAVDLRARHLSDSTQAAIARDLGNALGGDYDVVSEHYPGNPNRDHIHLEYDDRR